MSLSKPDYARVLPAAPHLEQYESITRDQFKAEIVKDLFNLVRYEQNTPGRMGRTADDYRSVGWDGSSYVDWGCEISPRCSPPEPPVVAAMDAAEAQLAPLSRLFSAVREGHDEPELLILAVTRLRAAVELLEAVTATMTLIDHPALVPASNEA